MWSDTCNVATQKVMRAAFLVCEFWKYQWLLQYGRDTFGIYMHGDSNFMPYLPCDPDCVASRSFVNRPRSASMTVDSMSRRFVSCSVSRLGGTAEWWVEFARWRFVIQINMINQMHFAFKNMKQLQESPSQNMTSSLQWVYACLCLVYALLILVAE